MFEKLDKHVSPMVIGLKQPSSLSFSSQAANLQFTVTLRMFSLRYLLHLRELRLLKYFWRYAQCPHKFTLMHRQGDTFCCHKKMVWKRHSGQHFVIVMQEIVDHKKYAAQNCEHHKMWWKNTQGKEIFLTSTSQLTSTTEIPLDWQNCSFYATGRASESMWELFLISAVKFTSVMTVRWRWR